VTEQILASSAEMRAARLPLGVYIALGGMLAVIVGVTVIALALGQRAGPVAAPFVSEQPPSGAFVSGPLEPKETAAGAAGAAKSPAEPRFAEEVAALESALLGRLRQEARAVDPNCQVADAEIDPRDGIVSIRLSMPRVWSPEQTRQSILRVAAPIARAAATWDTRVSAVRVRCDVRQQGQPDRRAFVAEANLTTLAGPESTDETKAEELFPHPWWELELSEVAPPPTSPPPTPGATR
jgi:hypothetical protein